MLMSQQPAAFVLLCLGYERADGDSQIFCCQIRSFTWRRVYSSWGPWAPKLKFLSVFLMSVFDLHIKTARWKP